MTKLFRLLLAVTLLINGPALICAIATPAQASIRTASHEPASPLKDIASQQDLSQFITYYYVFPQPDLTVKSIYFAEKQGYLDKPSVGLPLIAFYSKLFAANPAKLQKWMQELKHLAKDHKSIIYTALYLANTAQTKKSAAILLKEMPASYKAQVATAAHEPTPFELRPIKSTAILDELWACFTATGEGRYVKRIISVLPWLDSEQNDAEKTIIAETAKWSLSSNAIQHKRVLAICKREYNEESKAKTALNEIITKAQTQTTKDADMPTH